MYMETLENFKKKLTTFYHSGMKGTNLENSDIRKNTIKDLYIKFFTDLMNITFPLHNNKTIKNFCGEWTKFNDKFKKTFFKSFRKLVDTDEQCQLIWMKFKGNCGEIFAEWYFRSGACQIIDCETYTTVDPDNENFTDASAISKNDEFPIGIQIKNWREEIKFDIFQKAAAQTIITANELKKSNNNIDLNIMLTPGSKRQILFSTVKRQYNKAMDQNDWLIDAMIEFIGPNEIDNYFMKNITIAGFKKEITNKILKKI